MVDNDRVAAALPSYEVGSELGRGACGVVLAGQHRQLGRLVAIKQLPRAFGADPAVRARFLAEARVLATLDHPHVVAIYDFVDQDGLCLLVMERLTGGTVWSRFHAGGFTPDVSCAILLAVCSGLHHAHQHGILHRDVKPENLMFSGAGTLKVTDLGIAKVIGGSSTLATRHGEILGTPAYIAPEQAQGYELTPATDVYAAGTLLYELLAGRLPFPADSDPATLLYRHVHEAPPPLIETAHAIPIDLAEVTDRAISKSPADRYQSAEAFGVAIAECAAKAWGRGWLGRTQVPVSASGPILTAALGEALPGERTGGATAVESAQPANTLDEPVAGDFLPIQLLHPELRTEDELESPPTSAPSTSAPRPSAAQTLPPQSAPLVPVAPGEPAPATIAPPAAASTAAASAPASVGGVVESSAGALGTVVTPGGSGPSFPSAPAAPGEGSGGGSRRALLTVIVAVVLVGALIGAAVFVAGRGKGKPRASTPPSTTTAATTTTGSNAPATAPKGSWNQLTADLDPVARMEAGSTVWQGQLWMMGGMTSIGKSTDRVEEYDSVLQKWNAEPSLPKPLHHLMAVTYRNRVVVLGGWYPSGPGVGKIKGNVSELAWEFDPDPKVNNWVPFKSMLDPRAAGAAAVMGNDILVAGGVGADGKLVTDAELFDGTNWNKIKGLPTEVSHLALVSDGHCSYAIGGHKESDDDISSALQRYCPNGGWNQLPNLSKPLDDPAAALVGGLIVVAGGESFSQPYNDVEAYHISSNQWTPLPPLTNARHGLALLTPDAATLYAIDGALGPEHNRPSNIVESLDLP